MPRTTHIPSKFTQSFLSPLLVVVGTHQVVIWKALIVLYRLVVVSRPNIDLLPIISTREGVGIRISSPKVTFQIRILTKELKIEAVTSSTTTTATTVIKKLPMTSISIAPSPRGSLAFVVVVMVVACCSGGWIPHTSSPSPAAHSLPSIPPPQHSSSSSRQWWC